MLVECRAWEEGLRYQCSFFVGHSRPISLLTHTRGLDKPHCQQNIQSTMETITKLIINNEQLFSSAPPPPVYRNYSDGQLFTDRIVQLQERAYPNNFDVFSADGNRLH
jgi:hypothetical protein